MWKIHVTFLLWYENVSANCSALLPQRWGLHSLTLNLASVQGHICYQNTEEVLSHFQTRWEKSCSSTHPLHGMGDSYHLSQLPWDHHSKEATWYPDQQPRSAPNWQPCERLFWILSAQRSPSQYLGREWGGSWKRKSFFQREASNAMNKMAVEK